MYKCLVVTMIAWAVTGCATSSAVNEPRSHKQVGHESSLKAFDDRSTDVQIVNWITAANSDLIFVDEGMSSGEWKTFPPNTIRYNTAGKMGTTSNAWLNGAGGWVRYKVKTDGAIIKFKWNNPYTGGNSYTASAEPDDYYFTRSGGGGNNASVTLYVRKKTQPTPLTRYSAIIMADAQPWALYSGGDANSDDQNGRQWREINQNTFRSILTHKDVKFHINNGDLSEYGRRSQYNDYANIYRSSDIPVAEGLGNHDYANNVHDCMDYAYWGTSSNGCALGAVAREYDAIQNMKSKITHIPGSSFSADAEYSHGTMSADSVYEDFKGSFAYSWDVGDIHYVQLQNYPTYSVKLAAYGAHLDGTAEITDSLDWLANDLSQADLRGKISLINFHDARPYYFNDKNSHFISKNHLAELSKFKSIITSHHVKAIFVGHTHIRAYCRAKDDTVFGNIPVYTAGALFNGDYYLIDVNGKEINVKAYNGKTGFPRLVTDLGIIGRDTRFSYSCSRL